MIESRRQRAAQSVLEAGASVLAAGSGHLHRVTITIGHTRRRAADGIRPRQPVQSPQPCFITGDAPISETTD